MTVSDQPNKTDEEWRESLTPEQYQVLRKKGTERAFTGEYWDTKDPGTYVCAGCGTPLFDSGSKFDSAVWLAELLRGGRRGQGAHGGRP